MYSIAKVHYTTITMNKEGTVCFVKKKKKDYDDDDDDGDDDYDDGGDHDYDFFFLLIRLDPNSATKKPWHETREKFWIHKLKSLKPFGINATEGLNQIGSRPNRPRQNLASHTQSVPSISDT